MTEEQDALIAAENRKKENCIHHILQMCYESGAKVTDITPAYGVDNVMEAATIYYVGGSEKIVRFRDMSALDRAADNLCGRRCTYYHAEGNHHQRSFGVGGDETNEAEV